MYIVAKKLNSSELIKPTAVCGLPALCWCTLMNAIYQGQSTFDSTELTKSMAASSLPSAGMRWAATVQVPPCGFTYLTVFTA